MTATLGKVLTDGRRSRSAATPPRRPFGLTINLDIVWATLFAAAIVLDPRVSDARAATRRVPGKLQLFWEALVEQVQDMTDSAIGSPRGGASSRWR